MKGAIFGGLGVIFVCGILYWMLHCVALTNKWKLFPSERESVEKTYIDHCSFWVDEPGDIRDVIKDVWNFVIKWYDYPFKVEL